MSKQLFQNKFRTDTVRAPWHDYNTGEFFITICTAGRKPYLGRISNQTMYYTEIGRFTQECIAKMETLHPDITVPIFQVMPDHVHAIIHVIGPRVGPSVEPPYYDGSTTTPNPNNINANMRNVANRCGRLSHVISRFKCAVTKYAHENSIPFLWQTRFYDRIIRDRFEWDALAQYIKDNVANWASRDDYDY